MVADWATFDGWCASHGFDPAALPLDRLLSVYLFALLSTGDEERSERIEEALAPPNRIDPLTGMPYGWNEDDELAGLDDLLRG